MIPSRNGRKSTWVPASNQIMQLESKLHRFKYVVFLLLVWLETSVPRVAHGSEEWWELEPIVWGLETNGLSAGLLIYTNQTTSRFIPVLRRQVVATNWLYLSLPPKENLLQMDLWDAGNRAVAKTDRGRALGRPLREPLRVVSGINYHAGYSKCAMPPPEFAQLLTNLAFTLDDYFNITNAGNYHLKFLMRVVWFPPGWKGDTTKGPPPTILLPPVEAVIKIEAKTE